jgi:hypothetical protein
MWPEFADCQECVDEEEYVEYMLELDHTQKDIDGFLKKVHDAKQEVIY